MIVRTEKRRGFQPPWYTVIVYRCDCGELTLRKNWSGPTPSGGVRCPTGKHTIGFDGGVTCAP